MFEVKLPLKPLKKRSIRTLRGTIAGEIEPTKGRL
jgi:hypothetical protein